MAVVYKWTLKRNQIVYLYVSFIFDTSLLDPGFESGYINHSLVYCYGLKAEYTAVHNSLAEQWGQNETL